MSTKALKIFALIFFIKLIYSNSISSSEDKSNANEPSQLNEEKIVISDGSEKTVIDYLEKSEIKKQKEKYENNTKKDKHGKEENDQGDSSKKNAWLKNNRNQIINSLLILTGFAMFVLVGFKYYTLNKSIKEQNAEIENYADQLEQIIDGTDRLVFMTWKDQKEGIRFVDNPAYKKKSEEELTKLQQIQVEIEKVENDIEKKSKEIDLLREKELYYMGEIEKLEHEFESARAVVLDEGAALGFAETVLKEFK